MDAKLLLELIIISACSVPVVLISQKFKIPVIVGFLLTGVMINPHLSIFRFMDIERIHVLSEVGVVCLLFTIGLEFSLKKIRAMKKTLLVGGGVQILATVGLVAVIGLFLSMKINQAIFLGCLVSVSSTALVLSILQGKGLLNTPYGQVSLAILIFQDIAAVLMVILLPILGGQSASLGHLIADLAVKFGVLIAASLILNFLIIPKLLYSVARTQSRELFIVAVFFIFTSMVGLAGALGISMALGAFIAGVLIAESPYSYRALGSIMPFKDVFTSIFFVSQGIMLSLDYAVMHFPYLLFLALVIILVKFIGTFIAVSLLKGTGKIAFMSALCLCQIGEFSFVLFQEGTRYQLFPMSARDLFLGASIISMLLTPMMIQAGPALFDFLKKVLDRFAVRLSDNQEEDAGQGLAGHIVIVGYGIMGRRLALGAQLAAIPYIVIEMNPDTVSREKAKGVPIFYGDAAQESVLGHAEIEHASAIAVTIPSETTAALVVSLVKRVSPAVHILVRTRFEALEPTFIELGAADIVVEENVASYEMLSKMLKFYVVPTDIITKILLSQRMETAEPMGAHGDIPGLRFMNGDNQIFAMHVTAGSFLTGKTLAQLDLRRKFHISVLMIRRGDVELVNLGGDETVEENDVLVLLGRREALSEFVKECAVNTP